MNKANIYDIGFCFCFDLYVDDDNIKLVDFMNDILDKKASALIMSECFDPIVDSPFYIGDFTIMIYHTYSRRAYDLYYKYGGKNIRAVDPVAVQCILNGLGIRSARCPEIVKCSGVIYERETA